MTWAVYADHVRRIMPYMVKLHAASVTPADTEAVEKPTRKPKVL